MISLSTCHINLVVICIPGPRQPGTDDGVVTQRRVDGDGRPRRLRQVLAEQHEQCQDVPGTQGGPQRHQVARTILSIIFFSIGCD